MSEKYTYVYLTNKFPTSKYPGIAVAYSVPRGWSRWRNYNNISELPVLEEGTWEELEKKYPVAYDFRLQEIRHRMPKDQTVKCQVFQMTMPTLISKENLEDKNLSFYVCDECGMLLYSDGVHHFNDDKQTRLCYPCLLKHNQCQCCHGFFKNDLETLPFNTKVCKACAKTPQFDSDVEEYHTMKDMGVYNFVGEEPRSATPYLGFELEVDADDDDLCPLDATTQISDEFYGFFKYERDGSLENGFEIISNPISVNYLNAQKEHFEKLTQILRNNGWKSHDIGTCGLHVHIDKEYFGENLDIGIAKILYIFEKFWEELKRFSRRNNDQINDWARKYNCKITKVVDAHKKKKMDTFGRYYAVNLTNYHTIEFRLWRGTLNPKTLLATLNLSANIAKIAKLHTSAEIHNMKFEDLFLGDENIQEYWTTRNH